MWWLLTITIPVLFFVLYAFFAPLYIEVDSLKGIYRIRVHRLLRVSLIMNKGTLWLDIYFMFWQRRIDLTAAREKSGKQRPAADQKRKNKRPRQFSLKKVKAVLGSFKVSRCYITFDTGQPALNGKLYPWVYWLGFYLKKDISVNFTGKNAVVLTLRNNLARMTRAYLKNK
jgi:hypothetical protein